MKTIIATALVATLGFASAASAMNDGRVKAAQDTLETYGFNVDASELSTGQVNALAFFGVDTDIERNGRAEARAKFKINTILK